MKKNIYRTAAVVTGLSIAERALGFLYRIVLSRLIGAEGLGLYQVALSVFSVFITLGTGVGGGIVIGGRPYSGAHGIGSEIGHMIIKMDGEPCTCGNKGCFERYASATAIIREAKRAVEKHPESAILARCGGNPEKINAKIVIDCAKEGDATAKQVFDDYVKALAHGIVSIFNMLDPEVIVLGGGVSMAGEYLLDAVRAAVKPLVFFKTLPYPSIQLARLGADAGIIGAAVLGM